MASPEELMEHLRKIFELLEHFLKMEEFDMDHKEELSAACPDYMTVLSTAKRDLFRSDCCIVVAGETSAGKTSLVNRIIKRKKLLVEGNLATTGSVCRIRNSEEMMVKVFSKDEVLKTEEQIDDIKQLKSTLKKFTDKRQLQNEIPDAYYVDVYLPVAILKGNVVIVDTPGIGETENLDKMLLDFLPHAVSFIFIVNAHNAGGIHEYRLLKILKTVLENRHKMPCFDPHDVMFLTNKWELVENDSDDEEGETEQEKTLQEIQYKLEKGWGSISPNNLFRVSLKQVSKDIKSEFTDEYGRFEQVLLQTIARNENKRMKYYYRFLKTFTSNAQRGTLARLQLLERSEDAQHLIWRKNREEIATLTKQCDEAKATLNKYKHDTISKLADRLHGFLHSSDGKDEILNPPWLPKISTVSKWSLKDEVPKRVEQGIKKWCERQEVKTILKAANEKIKSILIEIEGKLNNIESDFTGVSLSKRHDSIVTDMLSVGILFLLPLSFIFAFTFGVVLTSIVAICAWVVGVAEKKIMVDEIYDNCLKKVTRVELFSCFEKSFGNEYDKILVDVFDKTVPKKLTSLHKLGEKLIQEHINISQKRKSLMRLKDKVDSLQNEIRIFEVKINIFD